MTEFDDLVGGLKLNRNKILREELSDMLRSNGGRLSNDDAANLSAHGGRSVRTIWRWARELNASEDFTPSEVDERSIFDRLRDDGKDAFEFTSELVDIVYALGGNLTRLHSELVAAGLPVPSYTTVTRKWRKLDPLVRDGAFFGQKNRDRNTIKIRHGADRPDQIWELDDLEADIEVLRKRNGKAVIRPHLLLLLDDRSRFVRAYALLDHVPTSADVVALLADAIEFRPADDGSGVLIGGPCETLLTDNASYFRSLLVEETIAQIPTLVRPNAAYCPTSKAKVERLNQTIQNLIVVGIAGVLSPAETKKRTAAMAVSPGALLTFDELEQRVREQIHSYNYDLTHSALGCTPFEMYSTRTVMPAPVADEILASMWLPGPRAGGVRKVHPDGLHVFDTYYASNELRPFLHKEVEVRTLHHRRDHVAMFHNDRFVAKVPLISNLTEAERRAIVRSNVRAQVAVDTHASAARDIVKANAYAISTGGNPSPVARAVEGPSDDASVEPPGAEVGKESDPTDRPPRPTSRPRSNPNRGGSFPATTPKNRPALDLARQAVEEDTEEGTTP